MNRREKFFFRDDLFTKSYEIAKLRERYYKYMLAIKDRKGKIVGYGKIVIEFIDYWGEWSLELMNCSPQREGIGGHLYQFAIKQFKKDHPDITTLRVHPTSSEEKSFFGKRGYSNYSLPI
ncbi:MAG: hypothetical protein Solivirus1_74 [Solivirus sp.]|uniref:N-acetyltransferase domain-containing protein n=1 Tax=Solivirus sp. TaxID=2487772 RepID=A0A3G5AFG2_9VIRU|nr:MAG: hypothetical protein Solivirus1_74 [Solivirus sp.]